MTKLINFCGGSDCANPREDSWPVYLSRLLKYEIIGLGKNGSAYEYAIESFNPKAEITIFCWTEPHRIHHPTEAINMASVEKYRHENKIYAAAHEYYKHLHSFEYDLKRRDRDFYWFDQTVLKNYTKRGKKVIHLFSYHNCVYAFKNGITIRKPLDSLYVEPSSPKKYANHMTRESNIALAKSLYKLLT